MPLDKCMGLED
jgi:hypothetical protein